MRKLSLIGAAVLLAACAARADPRNVTFSLATGNTNTATTSTTAISGYIDEIVLELPSGATATGAVAVTATPPIGAALTIASKTISATQLVRPRFDGTGTDGTALTDDPPGRYLSYGDTITATITSADPTGLVWRVRIKYDDGKR